jgi:hypothetical protein
MKDSYTKVIKTLSDITLANECESHSSSSNPGDIEKVVTPIHEFSQFAVPMYEGKSIRVEKAWSGVKKIVTPIEEFTQFAVPTFEGKSIRTEKPWTGVQKVVTPIDEFKQFAVKMYEGKSLRKDVCEFVPSMPMSVEPAPKAETEMVCFENQAQVFGREMAPLVQALKQLAINRSDVDPATIERALFFLSAMEFKEGLMPLMRELNSFTSSILDSVVANEKSNKLREIEDTTVSAEPCTYDKISTVTAQIEGSDDEDVVFSPSTILPILDTVSPVVDSPPMIEDIFSPVSMTSMDESFITATEGSILLDSEEEVVEVLKPVLKCTIPQIDITCDSESEHSFVTPTADIQMDIIENYEDVALTPVDSQSMDEEEFGSTISSDVDWEIVE